MDNPNNSDAERRSLPASPPPPKNSTLGNSRLAKMLGQVWLHFPGQDLPEEAWTAVGQDFLKALQNYPIPVVERAIERGLRVWKFRPNIAEMVSQCERAREEAGKPPTQGYDGSKSRGGYTMTRRIELARAWFNAHANLASEAKDGGWYVYLRRDVEDGANILAQIEWDERNNPGSRMPAHHTVNLFNDPVRGWEIYMVPDKLARWRSGRKVAA